MEHYEDKLQPYHIIKLVDVDYYVDMPKLLSKFQPVILYTFVPTKLSGSLPDATFHIEDNQVHTTVNGGATYLHSIWDYESDTIQVDYWWGSVIYLVEQRLCDDNRRIIFLNPSRKVFGIFAWLLPGHRLQRKRYLYENVNMMRTQSTVNNETNVTVHIGMNKCRVSCQLREDIFIATKIRCDLAKDPSISDVERIFRAHGILEPDIAAAIFIQIYRTNPKILNELTGVQTTASTVDQFSYQTLSPLITEDGKVVGRQLFKPIFDSGFIARKSFNNDTACIEGRITQPRNTVKHVPPFYNKCRDEFLEHLIPKNLVHTFVPKDEWFVELNQNRPTQRALAERAKPFSFFHKFVVSSFQKAEVYGKINYPRNISTVPTDHKLRFSGYTYSFAELLKEQPWYAFGLNPRQVTDAICDLVGDEPFVTTNDFSNYDGSHGEFKTQFDQMLFTRLFAKQYHPELLKLLQSMTGATAFTNHGVRYNTGHTVLSGSASTSSCNTVMNALIAYIALRVSGLGPAEAYLNLGLYGGDDNVNRRIDPELHTKVAAKLGYVLKTEKVSRGQPLPFLGRIFLDPWATRASICDVPRRLRNLHLTIVPKHVPKSIVLRRRAQSYLINDPNTPIITEWANMVLGATEEIEGYNNELRVEKPWFCDPENNWTAPSDDEWGFALSYIAYQLQVDPSEIRNFINLLKTCKRLEGPGVTLTSLTKVSVEAALGHSIVKP
uniref:RNA replicase n=1 Tax=Beihai noda-like virus 6 TaxID=1922488 RepID=A0A1L3KFL9_9VIRU|nr:hypothetical protein 1 [Beihai noda-like virus 6]